MMIPLDSFRDESSRLILAIIRWLRTSPKQILVVIPESLRVLPEEPIMDLGTDPTSLEKAELRMTLADRAALVVLWLVFPVMWATLALLNAPKTVIVLVLVPLAVAGSALVWWLGGKFSLVSDASGFTKSFLFWKKRAAWEDVACFTFGRLAGTGVRSATPRFGLWDANGRLLLGFSRNYGSWAEWQRLVAYVHVQLRRVLSPEKLNKPWKSRPRRAP